MSTKEKSKIPQSDEEEVELDENAPPKKFEPFLELKEVAGVLNSTNVDVLSQGLARLRSQLHAATSSRIEPSSISTRVLFEYFHSSSGCAELFKIWEFQAANHITQIESLVPDILAKIIQLAHSASTRSVGLSVLRRILRDHMKLVYRNLSSGRAPLCQATLRLLIAMNSFSQPTTREMVEGFNFQQKAISKFLVQRKKYRDEDAPSYKSDTRSLYLRFVLSFFVHGDARTKKDVLEIKDFASSIFKGLVQDSYEASSRPRFYITHFIHTLTSDPVHFQLIEEVLSVMYERLIMDQELTKIYTRKDPDTPTEPAKIPANVVHHFLIAICCTPGVGVCFHDASWYPPNVIAQPAAAAGGDVGTKNVKIHNKILSKYVTSLRPTDDLRQQELLLKILKACPELVQVYWQSTTLTFDSRLSSKWLSNMTLLHKTISLPIPSLYFPLTQSYPTAAPPAHVIIDNILPACVSRHITSKALQHASPLVKHTTTVVLATAFQKLGRVLDRIGEVATELDEMQDERAALQFDTDAAAAQPAASVRWRQAAQHVRDEMRRRVPDVQIIVSLQHQISSLTPKAIQPDEVIERRAQQQVLHEATLRLIRYYQQHLPEAMMESKFDFGKLVPSDLVGVKAGPLMHLLELLLVLPDFKWTNKAADSSTSHLTTLLTLYLSTHYTHVRHLVQRILHKLLSESVLFQHDANEVCFWLEALPRNLLLSGFVGTETAGVLTEDQKNVLQFLDDCIGRCLKTPYRYVDDLASLVMTVNQRIQPEQNLSEEMDVDTLLTAMDKLRATAASALWSSAAFTHPFSPLLVTLIEQYPYMREQKPAAAAPVARFITRLITGLLGKLAVVGYLDECVRRIAEVVGIEGVGKEGRIWDAEDWDEKCIFIGLRNYFKGLMNEGVNEVVGKRDSKDSDLIISKTEERLLDFLKNFDPLNLQAARSGILSLLARMPVSAIDKHLVDLTNHCEKNLAWPNFEPLIEYLDIRHPFAGSLFEYRDFSRFMDAKNEDILSPSPVAALLRHIPFATLFFNINPLLMASPKIVKLLQHSTQHIPEDHISPACNLIILLLSTTLAHHGHWQQESREIVLATIKTCFTLLKDLLKAAQANETVYSALKEIVFGQSVLKELFLVRAQIEADENSTEDNPTKSHLEALDQYIVDLIFKVFRTDTPRTKTSRIDESLWRPYKQKVVDAILGKLSLIENKTAGISVLDHTVMSLFPHFANFCNEEDLVSILNQLLRLDFDWLFSTTFSNGIQRFNNMLSEVLTRLSKVTSSGSTISAGAFKVLAYLWQSHPSPELDTLICEFLELSLPPNVLWYAIYQYTEASAADIAFSEQRLFGTLPGGMEPTIVTFILNHINLTRVKILSLLIVGDSRYRAEFVKWALDNKNLNRQLKLPEMTIVMNAFSIAVSTISTDNNILWRQSATEDDRRLVVYFLEHLGSSLLSVIHATPSLLFDRHDFLLETTTLVRLVELSPPVEFSLLVLNMVKKRGAFLLNLDSLRVVEAALKITIEQEKKDEFLRTYIQEFLKSVTELVNTDKLQGSTEVDRVFRKLVSIGATSSTTSLISLNSDIVRDFVFAILLDRFSVTSIIEFTTFLISRTYKQHQKDEPIQTYLRMAIEHKDFEQLTIPPTPSQKPFAPTPESSHRLALIKLIHILVQIRPSAATKHSSHVDSLLSSYSATIAPADRLILNFLVTVERHSRTSIVAKAMLWGPGSSKARNQNAQRGGLMSSGASMIAESLALLDPLMLMYSYAKFPITRPFLSEEQDVNDEESAAPAYDPAFLLPLFSSLMTYGNQLDCRKFIETNALGFVVVAMSSLDEEVRKVSYFLMDEFYILLEHATFREKKQILLLLDSLKNAITDSNDKDGTSQRIPTIITVFVAHALGILLQPAHFMYPYVNKFLLQRPFIDLEDIPMFYSLFNTSTFSLKKDRVWILRLLSAGVKCAEDYKLFKRRHVWDIISSYYNSQIADSITRSIVIEILFNITAIPTITVDLLTHSGLLTFLHNTAVAATHAEHIVLTARLLLRTLLSAHERYDRLQWLGRAYLYQSASIATALIHATEQLTVSKAEVTVVLITVLDILKIFHYIALVSVAVKPEANVGTSTFTPYHAKRIVNILRKCEPCVELVCYRQSKSIFYPTPSGTDALDSLYRFPVALLAGEMYGQTVGILLELMVQGEGFARDREGSFKFAAARALALGAEEKIGSWVMECLGEAR